MGSTTCLENGLTERRIAAAAQNFVAAEFALHGFDVLSQSGRAYDCYDLSVATTRGMMKVMVHGSREGLWDLIEPYIADMRRSGKIDYRRAIDLWLVRYRQITCCLVQFDSANLAAMPRIYLASAAEVAGMLQENVGAGREASLPALIDARHESLPQRWQFSQGRIAELMAALEGRRPVDLRVSTADRCRACAEIYPAKCVQCLPMMN